MIRLAGCTAGNGWLQFCDCWQGMDKGMKWHFCAVWRQEEKSKILVGRIRVKEQPYELPTSKPHSHGRRHRRGRPAHREEEDQVANGSVEFQSFQVNNSGATSMGGRQSVLPRRITTPSQSEIKSVSNNCYCSSTSRTTTSSQSEISGFLPKHQYY